MNVNGFFGPFKFLSNFYYVDVIFGGRIYHTTEHAYQASKALDPAARVGIQLAGSPREAKMLGNALQLRPNWDSFKLDVMLDLQRQKFAQEPLRTWLLETGDGHLEETNHWGDRYWGVCGGVGENHLGRILMQVRTKIREKSNAAERDQ